MKCDMCDTDIMVSRKRLNSNYKHHFCSMRCNRAFHSQSEAWYPPIEIAAYIAGILDGEGCIHMLKRNNGTPKLTVTIGNTNKEVIEFIHKQFKGIAYINLEERKTNIKSKPIFIFVVNSFHAISFLAPLSPYLIVKKQHRDAVIAWRDLQPHERLFEARGKEFVALFHSLNKRGRIQITPEP